MRLFVRGRLGHLGVNLTREGKYRMHSVHVLIATTFHGPKPSADHLVMHLDDNPANNRADNLEWGTPAENSKQMVERGRSARGDRIPWAKLAADQVTAIREALARGISTRNLARIYNVAPSTIQDIASGRSWRHAAS